MSEEAAFMDPLQKDIVEMKSDIKTLEKEVSEIKSKTVRHDEQIFAINKTLDNIRDDTKWIKQKIMGAIITAICTGVIGGAIAVFYANM